MAQGIKDPVLLLQHLGCPTACELPHVMGGSQNKQTNKFYYIVYLEVAKRIDPKSSYHILTQKVTK